MEIREYDLENTKDLEQLCKDAADRVWGIPQTQGEFAMQLVIQNLVMPQGTDSFGEKQMAEWILRALQVKKAARKWFGEYHGEGVA